MALERRLLGRGGGPHQLLHGIAGRESQQDEREGDHAGHDGRAGQGAARKRENHAPNLARPRKAR